MASSSKRQQTMAKRNREQAVREKRELKLAKKHAAAAERNAPPEEIELTGPLAEGWVPPEAETTEDGDGDTSEAEPLLADAPQAEGVTDDTSGS
jgi:hypothetical protein